MTDKKIIIDGIDVTGCEWISEVGLDSEYICNCNSPNKTSGYCKYNPNCCYKQLKRRGIKLGRDDIIDLCRSFEEKDTLHLIIDRLLEASGYDTNTASAEDFEDVYENMRYAKQQLNQLKAENKELKKELFRLNSTIDFVKVTEHSAISKYNRFKQILTEIKEIAEENIRIADLEGLNGVYRRGLAKQILQKISECVR